MRDLDDVERENELLAERRRAEAQRPKREQLIKELAAHVKSQMSHAAYHAKPHEFIARWLLSDVIPLKEEHAAEGMVDAQTRIQAERDRAKRAEAQLDDMVEQRNHYRDQVGRILDEVRAAEEYRTWESPTQPS